MGQQQLLLVILVVIIVGITTIIAVNIMGIGADNANRDAVRQDLVTAASNIRPVWERPTAMNGAERDFSKLTNAELIQYLNIPSSTYIIGNESISNENGTYNVEVLDDSSLKIIGEPLSGGTNIEITVTRNSATGQWSFDISEVEPNN